MAKKVDDETVVVEEEEESSQPTEVQVDLKETPSKEKEAAGKEPSPEAKAAEERRWKALENQIAASRRVNDDLRTQLKTLNERLKPAELEPGGKALPEGTAQDVVDQYDRLVADGKWQEAVRVLAREEYKVARQTETAQEQLRTAEERRLSALERSKQKVRDAYPTLREDTGNAEAPESVLYNEAVAELTKEDDQFLHDPYAPELAMHRMEQLARTRGVGLTRMSVSVTPARPRGAQTSMPASRGSGGATSYTLTREQKEWCDANLAHLPEEERYKHYARFAKMSETTGGVET